MHFITLLVAIGFSINTTTPSIDRCAVIEWATHDPDSNPHGLKPEDRETILNLASRNWTAISADQILKLGQFMVLNANPSQIEVCMTRWTNELVADSSLDIASIAFSFELLARLDQGKPAEIIDRYESKLVLTQAIYGPRLTVTYASALATVGRYQDAITTLEKTLASDKLVNDTEMYANTLNSLANLYYDMDLYEEARFYFEKIINDLGLGFDQVIGAHVNLASTYRALELYDEAIEALDEIISYSQQNGFLIQELQSTLNLANTYKEVGYTEKAIEGYRNVTLLSREHDIPIGEIYAYLNYAILSIEEKQFVLAGQLLDTLTTLVGTVSDVNIHIALYEAYSDLSAVIGESDIADKFNTYAVTLKDLDTESQDISEVVNNLYRISFLETRLEVEKLKSATTHVQNRQNLLWMFGALMLIALFVGFGWYAYKRGKLIPRQSPRSDAPAPLLTEDEKVLQYLTDTILSQKLYQNPELGIADLAMSSNLTQRRIRQAIQDSSFATVVHFLNTIRVDQAKKIMADDIGVLSQEEIAAAVGFGSYRTYGRVFSRITGETPSAFRERIRKTNNDVNA